MAWFFPAWFDYEQNPEKYAIRNSEQLLALAQEDPERALPFTYSAIGAECWMFLQQAMLENNGQYRLTTFNATMEGTYPPPGGSDVYVQVDFPNNRQVQLVWYAGGVTQCFYRDSSAAEWVASPSGDE